MTEPIRIAKSVVEAIVDHARTDAPRECCGLLVSDGTRIDEAVATPNIREGTTRYEVDPRAHFSLIRRLRGTNRTIAGTYHSHPASPATPSPTDVAEAYTPEFVYVIVSLQDAARPEVRAFRITEGRTEVVSLAVG